jgi:hypothetical protein
MTGIVSGGGLNSLLPCTNFSCSTLLLCIAAAAMLLLCSPAPVARNTVVVLLGFTLLRPAGSVRVGGGGRGSCTASPNCRSYFEKGKDHNAQMARLQGSSFSIDPEWPSGFETGSLTSLKYSAIICSWPWWGSSKKTSSLRQPSLSSFGGTPACRGPPLPGVILIVPRSSMVGLAKSETPPSIPSPPSQVAPANQSPRLHRRGWQFGCPCLS